MWEVIKLYMSKIWTILKPIVKILLTTLFQEVLNIAVGVVTDLASTDLSNSEKREAAFDQIKEKLAAEGKEVGSSLINLAIELAVQKLKDSASS